MNCPSCGAEIDADRRYCRLVICPYCNSSVVLDEEAARVAGKMAVLARTPGPLYVGGTGTLSGKGFTVLGRVRYGYTRGFWDEWFLRMDDGRTAWISEDENNFTLEVHGELADVDIDYARIGPGDPLTVGGVTYHVDEKDIAECEGGEGQLPFSVLTGERIPFLDLSTSTQFATIEFDLDDQETRVFQGRRLDPDMIRMDQTAEQAGAYNVAGLSDEREAGNDRRERIVRSTERSKSINCRACGGPLAIPDESGDAIECDHCGTTVDLNVERRIDCPECQAVVPLYGGRQAKRVVCPQCHASLDVSRFEPSLLQVVSGIEAPAGQFKIGRKCHLRGDDYTVVGMIRFREIDEGISYYSNECLLWSDERGYRWLMVEDGHYSLTDELEERPTGFDPEYASQKETFRFLDRKWRVFESGETEVVWVDGELPWVAQLGDKNHYMDAISPPYLLSAEWTETEQEWYLAEYLDRAEVADALGIARDQLPPPTGVGPHQPFRTSRFSRQSIRVMAIAAAVFMVATVFAWFQNGRLAGDFRMAPKDYAQEYVTPAFEIKEPHTLCIVRFDADVSNSWVYLESAVLNEKDEALLDFSTEISYYYGRSGGESWSEGSKKDSVAFKLEKPGQYRFLVLGQAGSGSQPGNTVAAGKPVRVRVYEGTVLARYYGLGALFCFGWVVFGVGRRAVFEGRRWSPVLEDDDDD